MDLRDRENILDDLRSTDEEVRRLAVERLPTLPAAEGVPCLVEHLGDSSWRVRKAAIERLSELPQADRAISLLVESLSDGDNPGRRNAALDALIRCGGAAVPPLLEACLDSDVDVRKQVVDALGGIGDPRAAGRLVELLADPDPNVRGAAADALGQVGDEAVRADLLRAAREDAETLVKLSALGALVQLGVSLSVDELEDPLREGPLRPAAYALLSESDDPRAIDTVAKGLAETSRVTREAAIGALVRMAARGGAEPGRLRDAIEAQPEILSFATVRLLEAPRATRLDLVQFLSLAPRPESVVPLLDAAGDETLTDAVLASLEAFGEIAELVIDRVFDSAEVSVRRLACRVLGAHAGSLGQGRLRAALADSAPSVRAAAARALARHGHDSAVPLLVDRLVRDVRDEDADDEEIDALVEALSDLVRSADEAGHDEAAISAVALLGERLSAAPELGRSAIARVFGAIGRSEGLPRVGLLMSDASERVRRAAVEALARLSVGETPESLRMALVDESPSVRIAAASALASCGDAAALRDLATLAADEDERVRAASLRAVGVWLGTPGAADDRSGRDCALALLEEALAKGSSEAMAALCALDAAGGESAARLARGMFDAGDPELVRAAVGCVGNHGQRGDLEALLGLVGHEEWAVRAAVIEVLGDRRFEPAAPSILGRLESERDDFVRRVMLSALERLEA